MLIQLVSVVTSNFSIPPFPFASDYLAQLIELSGGGLVSSTEETALGNRSTFVVCDEEELHLPSGSGLVQVRSEWILDCLSNYRYIQNFRKLSQPRLIFSF